MIRMFVGQNDQDHQDRDSAYTPVKMEVFAPVIVRHIASGDRPQPDPGRPGRDVECQTECSPITLGENVRDDSYE